MSEFPIVYSVHHGSHDFGDFAHRCALTLEQRVRYSDYGSDETVPRNGRVLRSFYSRGVVDLNRAPDALTMFPREDFGRPRNFIWKLGAAPNASERDKIFREIYLSYHDELSCAISAIGKKMAEDGIPMTTPILLVAWDNTGHYAMKSHFILSNDGDRGIGNSTNARVKTTCRAELLEELSVQFRSSLSDKNLPDDVHMNIYKDTPHDECGYIVRRYNSYVHPGLKQRIGRPVEALQLEYDTEITHDNRNLHPNYSAMEKLRVAFETAIEATYYKLWPARRKSARAIHPYSKCL